MRQMHEFSLHHHSCINSNWKKISKSTLQARICRMLNLSMERREPFKCFIPFYITNFASFSHNERTFHLTSQEPTEGISEHQHCVHYCFLSPFSRAVFWKQDDRYTRKYFEASQNTGIHSQCSPSKMLSCKERGNCDPGDVDLLAYFAVFCGQAMPIRKPFEYLICALTPWTRSLWIKLTGLTVTFYFWTLLTESTVGLCPWPRQMRFKNMYDSCRHNPTISKTTPITCRMCHWNYWIMRTSVLVKFRTKMSPVQRKHSQNYKNRTKGSTHTLFDHS